MKLKISSAVAIFLCAVSGVFADSLLVLAAASTTDAMNELGALFARQSGHTVQFSFGSAGALARQLQNGAPADLFVSANVKWMDVLAKDGKIDSATRIDLLANRLVLIAPKAKPFAFSVESGTALPSTFAGRMAVGNMESVPVGMYTRQMLETYGWLDVIKPRLVSGDSVRNVLFFVERGEVDAGIVYATDARISDRVMVVTVFPESAHEPIRYPAAVCAASRVPVPAREFLSFLQTDAARAVFETFGFSTMNGRAK